MEDESDISIGPLKIWILGRQFPDSQSYWDGNWINTVALCEGNGSRVKIEGPFIHLGELKKWRADLEEFYRTLEGSVDLATMEPTLSVKLIAKKSGTGHLECKINLTKQYMSGRDYATERHDFSLVIDQSYLPGLLSQLTIVLRDYPIRGTPG
jgi:hypothetical protein